jgi:MFS family permease
MTSPPRTRWFILMMFMLAHAISDGYFWVIPPLLPSIREHFHLSYTEMGAYYTLFRFFSSIFQAPAAYLVHLAPTYALISGGLLWTSVMMFFASLSTSYGMFVWLSAASGIGRATYQPLAVAALSRIFGRDFLGRAIALHLSGGSVGQMIGPFMVSLLLGYSWQLPIMIWSVLGFLAGSSLFFFLKSQKEILHPAGKALRWPFLSRHLGFYMLSEGIWGIAQTGLMTFLPLFWVDDRGFSTGEAAALYGVMAVAGTLFRPFVGILMDRMGKRKPVIIGGFIIVSLSVVGLTTIRSPWMMYPSILLLGTFALGHSGLADTFMVEMVPSKRREETLGFIYTVRMGIASFSPVIVGFISEQITLTYAFLILGFVPIVSALILSLAEEKPMD